MVLKCPLTDSLVHQWVAGESWPQARSSVAALLDKGLKATVGFLAPAVRTPDDAAMVTQTYLDAIDDLAHTGWADQVDVCVNLSNVGLFVRDGEALALANVTRIATAAHSIGTTTTIGRETPASAVKTRRIVQALRRQFPDVGYTLQANLKRTEADCRTVDGGRARLVKGVYSAPASVMYVESHDVDLSYVRCMKALMESDATPLIATQDPVLIEIAQELAAHTNRGLTDFEFQMLYGVRSVEQERLADLGHTVRVFVPFGPAWYPYVIRRLAERPANLGLLCRSTHRH